MRIGYACLALGVDNTALKHCRKQNASETRLLELIEHNLNSLENLIGYNIANGIELFRISSDIIPFGSSSVNSLPWWEIFASKLSSIGEKIKNSNMRVSMHPGQYTVLNSPVKNVVENSTRDLNYHCLLLDSLKTGPDCKVILHIGGLYNNKKDAINRFIQNLANLDQRVLTRIVIENDDRFFNIDDVLKIGLENNIPVVFDNLHHFVNPPKLKNKISEFEWILACKETWQTNDGTQKVHYSQQDPLKKSGAHSKTIASREFLNFYSGLIDYDLDIMLEVKDKNLSAIKCNNLLAKEPKIQLLELEWGKYKYKVLEHSQAHYLKIRQLLKDKSSYPCKELYDLIEDALDIEVLAGSAINAAMHVWGYFRDEATVNETKRFFTALNKYKEGQVGLRIVHNLLRSLALKYEKRYLLDSYYFDLD